MLEEGLQTTYSQVSTSEHPLLRQDLLTIKKSPELFGIDQRPVAEHDATPEASQKHDDLPPRATSSPSSSKDEEEVSTARRHANLRLTYLIHSRRHARALRWAVNFPASRMTSPN